MTMEKLSQLLNEGHQIKSKFSVQLATELKEVYATESAKIYADRDLSPHGVKSKLEVLQKELAKDVMKEVQKQKAEYIKKAEEATQLAKKLKTDAIKPPSNEVDVKLFEKELTQLQTSIMLNSNPETAIQAINAFQQKYDEPYYASKLQEVFPSLIQSVTTIDPNPIHRTSLSRVYDRVVEKATTPEVVKADEVLSYFADGENVKLFREGLPATNTIKAAIGSITSHINTPDIALGILNGEVQTFAGMEGTNVMKQEQPSAE
ncbi:hypothetical protein MKY04_16185 [Lysinibacillus telephonicus]|uniref:hypothetical protein n=1 Tax=Lysinibacillus telephonicus TaxID=1714840 RepID=UPI0031FD9639